jgi:hypothetical protein
MLTSQRSSKLTIATMKDGLFSTIFGTTGLYNITHFAGINMLIQCVLTFHKILFPFTFIKSTSLNNSMCLFGWWKKINKGTKTSFLCVSQQISKTKFSLLNWCDVPCSDYLPSGSKLILDLVGNTILHPLSMFSKGCHLGLKTVNPKWH